MKKIIKKSYLFVCIVDRNVMERKTVSLFESKEGWIGDGENAVTVRRVYEQINLGREGKVVKRTSY